MNNIITCKVLDLEDLNSRFLSEFNRHQVTEQVWFQDQDEYKLKLDHFIDEWDDDKKAIVIEDLRRCVSQGGKVIGAYEKDGLAGFANIEGLLFGSKKDYVELPYIHVSYERRGSGIGKKLFIECCKEAKKLGAKKLYIAAHPSVESQAFYKAMGCKSAVEINQHIFEKEPLDLQLEILV